MNYEANSKENDLKNKDIKIYSIFSIISCWKMCVARDFFASCTYLWSLRLPRRPPDVSLYVWPERGHRVVRRRWNWRLVFGTVLVV